jgi:glycosyltransferase involved in cell wall biosynthesis
MSEIQVSIVIPTLNSEATFEACLNSIRANNSKYPYEIIVADAGSKDKTLEIAHKYADKVLTGVPGRINRNIGIENSSGNIICFTDSDCIVPANWINGLTDGLLRLNEKDSNIIGVGSGNIPILENISSMELAVAYAIRSPLVSYKARNVITFNSEQQVSHNPPISSAYFRNVLEEMEGFREEPGYPEDLDLDTRLIEKGYKLYYLPDFLVYHKHKSSLLAFGRQMHDFGRKRIRVNREHPDIARFFHYGPIFLFIMIFIPPLIVPLGMSIVNSMYVTLKERKAKLFFPVILLTMCFYFFFGLGELTQVFKRAN